MFSVLSWALIPLNNSSICPWITFIPHSSHYTHSLCFLSLPTPILTSLKHRKNSLSASYNKSKWESPQPHQFSLLERGLPASPVSWCQNQVSDWFVWEKGLDMLTSTPSLLQIHLQRAHIGICSLFLAPE